MTLLHALLAGLGLASGLVSSGSAGAFGQPTVAAQPPVEAERAPNAQPPAPPVSPPNSGAGDGAVRARYMIEAISFKALNETGIDFLGSDEVITRFAIDGKSMFTGIYGNVDTGDTVAYRSGQRCIFPAVDPDQTLNHVWACGARGAPGPLRFQITLYEHDGPIRHFLTAAGFCISYDGDDLTNHCDNRTPLESLTIGSGFVEMTEAELAALMPTVGASVERAVPIASAYRVNIRLTRLRGLLVPPVGGEPPVGPVEPEQPCVPGGAGPPCP